MGKPHQPASGAAHHWANLRTRNPFPLVQDVGRMAEGWRICEELADGPGHVIPGHDSLVLRRLPTLPGQADVALRHLPPLG